MHSRLTAYGRRMQAAAQTPTRPMLPCPGRRCGKPGDYIGSPLDARFTQSGGVDVVREEGPACTS